MIDTDQNLTIENALEKIKVGGDFMLGYPVSQDFDYSRLNEFLKYPINDIGNPFEKLQTRFKPLRWKLKLLTFLLQCFEQTQKTIGVCN